MPLIVCGASGRAVTMSNFIDFERQEVSCLEGQVRNQPMLVPRDCK